MKFLLLLLLSVIALSKASENSDYDIEEVREGENKPGPKQWALLVAGSDGWWNYRHQADVCHAYHILIKRGIPASNIIVMMKDDIANNPLNPVKGEIINKPNGTDVYKGVKIDYKGKDVTPKNFINILLGKKKAMNGIGSGRVIKSGPKDNVFINFSDHGGTGLICFPSEDLSANDLIKTLKQLTKEKKYGKLVLYIEACESGSMFDNILPQNTKILASTAAAYDESSWGCYCTFQDYPCLGDLYSINWMEHLDKKLPPKENLFDQYQTIRTLTTKSHVNLYGDYKIGITVSKEFVGPHDYEPKNDASCVGCNKNNDNSEKYSSLVPSREIPLQWIKRMASNAKNSIDRLKYAQMAANIEKNRLTIDEIVSQIIKKTTYGEIELAKKIEKEHTKLELGMLSCHEELYRLFSNKCVDMIKNPYVLKHFYKFANICHMDSAFSERAKSVIIDICDNSNFPKITGTL